MVHDALINAFGDSDIQQYILGRNDQNIILEDIIKFVEAKEAGRRSTSLQNLSASTLFSYKQLDKDQHLVKCRKCGKSGEDDRRDTQARKEKCKSWDKICSHCDKRNPVVNFMTVHKVGVWQNTRDNTSMLCNKASTALRVTPSTFPRSGSATKQSLSMSSAASSPPDEARDCSCLMRTKPTLPTSLSFPATDANRPVLQNWILDRHRINSKCLLWLQQGGFRWLRHHFD